MIKKLLLFTSAFILFSNFLSAQTIDEDGNQLSGVTLECNEVDQGTFDSDLEDLLDNYSWTNSDGGCNGNVDYDPASFDYGSFPPALTCGDLLSVDLDIDCDGTLIAITVDIEIDDTTDPIDTDPDFYDFVYECGDSGTDPQTELDDWIANIENNAVSDQVWLDECADQNATVAVINGPYTVDLTACNAPEVQVIVVEFEMADGCGNTSVFEADFIIEDNEDPLDFQSDSSLDDPNIAGIPCDMTLNEQEIQDWIDDLRVNGANSGFNYFSDGCTDPASLIINVTNNNLTQIDPVVLDFTQPMCPMSWLVDVTVEDLCGNFLSETYSFEIEDTADPEFMNGDNFYDVTVDPCEQNVGADHNVDFENWVTNTISDMQSNGDAIDACTPVADLVITANTTSITIDFEDCQNTPIIHEEEVEFTVTDLCGNTGTAVHVWTLIDNVDPALDITGWTQATPFPECNDLSTIQTAVENALLSGVLMEDCADISNLDIDDFNITPDLNGLSLDDLNFVTNSPSGCFEIMIDAEYEDPCGNLSNIATFTFMVDDNTPPDLGNLDCPSVNEYCPGEIETEQDILDLLFGGTRSFLNDIDEACVDDVDNYDVTEFNSFFPEDCGEMGFYEWQIADRCGNLGVNSPCTSGDGSVYRVEWEVNANGALDALQWIGDPEDFFPPEDFTIQYTDPNCTSEFDMMPASGMCLWEGIRDGMTEIEMWNWEAVEDVVWEGGCDVEVTYSHVPCSDALDLIENQMPPGELVPSMTNSALETEVCITIVDQCDATQLQYCFKVTIQCGSCGETGNIYCATCEESQPPLADGGCKLCDPMQLAEGYESCTPPCDDPSCPILGPPQPGVLCDSPGFVPHNMSWFAFVASSEESTVEVFIFNCVGAGVQSGIYTNCEFDEPCVGFNVNCSSGGTIEYDANFNVGQTYYMFVDGCNGSECEYEVTVDGLNELVPDDMDHLTAFSDCKNAELTDDFSTGADNASISGDCDAADMITVCPGEIIQFGVRHQGNIGNFPDNDRPCDEYPLLPAVFQWSTSWGDNYDFNPFEENTGFFVPAIEMPAAEGVYSICLDFIDYECYPVIGPTCLEINVVNLVKETYEHKVCAEDLEAPLNPMGWDPAGSNDDPNGDGIAWLGDFNVTLDEIQQWPENSDGYFCMDYVFKDPDCNCDVPQELCIDPVGQAFADKNPITLYLWECQVTECRPNRPTDCEAVPYEWVWDWNGPEEIVDLYGSNSMNPGQTIDECFRIDGYHTLEDDWRTGGSEFCDTIPIVTVEIAQPAIVIDSLGCGAYCVDMNQTYDDFDDDFEDWPQPFIPSTIVEFLDCDNGNVITTNECLFLDSPTDVCIKVTYEFQDGAWSDDGDNTHPFGPIIETCETIYGPFEWGQEPPNPPTYEGDDTFCATALTDHIFTIDSPNPALTYVWNQNPVVPGVVVTDISTNGDGSVVSIDLPAGFDPDGCTNVIAQGPCGESEPTDVCFMLLDPPTVSLDPIADVCITSAPDGNANITALVSAQASPASPNYVYTWMNGTSTTSTFTANTSFMFPSSGTQSVTVMVTDTVSNCSSVASLPVEFQVNDPLDPPLVSCGNQGQNELEITWEAVPGATGYTVFVDGVAQTPDLGPGDLSYTETGLQLGQTVNFSVMSLGGDPCFNSAVSTETPCTTTDCPPAGVSQDNSLIEPFTFCENDTPGVIDISSAFPFTDANGALAYVSTNNVVDDAGSFNTSGLTSGLYDIEVTYTFDDQCPPRIFNLQYTVTEVPDPSFEIESPICVNNGAAITGTPPGPRD